MVSPANCSGFPTIEIGRGQYFLIVSQPEISDNLGEHGETCSLSIQVERGGPYPPLGYPAFIVRNGVKEFGGLYLTDSLPFQADIETFNITLASYLFYMQGDQSPLKGYSARNTLTGHAQAAIELSDAFNGARPLNKIGLDVLGDDLTVVQFDFVGPGTLQQFIEDLCNQEGADWRMNDGGALSILNLTTGTISRLEIVVRDSVTLVAPRSLMTVPSAGESICDVFWEDDLLQTQGVPPASMVSVYGRNGVNKPGDGSLSTNEYLIYKSDGTLVSYDTIETADRILSILVET